MTTIAGWLNPTRAVGLMAYGAATVCCGLAWMRSKSQRRHGRLPALLTLIEAVLLLDIVFDWRWMLHGSLIDFAQRAHEYQSRRPVQVIALMALAGILLVGFFAVQRLFGSKRGVRLAVSGVVLSMIVWCTEVVSLHQVDHVLYHQVGGVMAVTLLWVLACLMTSIGALSVSRVAAA